MTFIQIVTPDPDIPCQPGWCLQYVRQAFGAPVVEPTATAGWENAQHKHVDRDFPGCWVPVWFSLEKEPAGHVALLAPDGSVYSTSDPYGTTPHHHPSLDDLIEVYSVNNPLTYLGWSEDISGVTVVQESIINVESVTEEDDMFTDVDRANLEKSVNQQGMIIEMLNNIAAAQNEVKPEVLETRDNVRKVTMDTVYGQDAK